MDAAQRKRGGRVKTTMGWGSGPRMKGKQDVDFIPMSLFLEEFHRHDPFAWCPGDWETQANPFAGLREAMCHVQFLLCHGHSQGT